MTFNSLWKKSREISFLNFSFSFSSSTIKLLSLTVLLLPLLILEQITLIFKLDVKWITSWVLFFFCFTFSQFFSMFKSVSFGKDRCFSFFFSPIFLFFFFVL